MRQSLLSLSLAVLSAAAFTSWSVAAEGDIAELADKANWSATVSGNGDGQGAAAIIDGDESNMWQCDWKQDAWFCIDLGSRRTIRAFKYRPRQNDHSIKDYEFWVLDEPVTSYDEVYALSNSHTPASVGVLPFANDPTYVEVEAPQVGRYVVMHALSTYQHSAGCREFWLYGENGAIPAFSFWPSSMRLYTGATKTFALSATDHNVGDATLYATLGVADDASAIASLTLGGATVTSGATDAASFTAGVCDQGDLSVTASANAGVATLTLSEGSSGFSALARSATVESVARKVRLIGSPNIGVGEGTSVTRTIQIVDSELAAPGAIALSVGEPSSANATISGDASIAADAFASSGALTITGVSEGATTIELTLGNNFVFEETGASTLTLNVSTLGDVIYVSPDGSDATGLGSPDSPLRSISAAAVLARDSGADICVAAGLYDAAHGENFPIQPPTGIEIVGVPGQTVIDCGGTAGAIRFPADFTIAGLIHGLVISNALDYAIVGGRWFGTVSDCEFVDINGSTDDAAIFSQDIPDGLNNSLVFTNCVFRDISTSGSYWIRCSYYYGNVDFFDCTFKDLAITGNSQYPGKTGPIVMYSTYCNATRDSTVRFLRCDFDGLNVARPTSNNPGGDAGYWESGIVNPWAKTWIDRCTFRHCSAPFALIGGNRGQLHLFNSLVYDCDCGEWGLVRDFYGVGIDVRNCTFDQVGTLFHTDQFNAISTVRNLSISHATKLNPMDGTRLILKNCNIYDTPVSDAYATQYDTINSSGITSFAPDYFAPYAEGSAVPEDYRLQPFSELIDIGDNSAIDAGYALDLAGKPRAFSASGDAIVDLGAYESRFGSPDATSFFAPSLVVHAFAGESVTIPVSVNPAPESPVAILGAVALGDDLSTETPTLSFATGAETIDLVVTSASTLTEGDGERLIATVTESGTSVGVEPLAVAVYVHEKKATLGIDGALYIREGETVEVPVKLYSEGATAPADIEISLGTKSGSGTSEIAWNEGAQEIPAGAAASDGAIAVTGGNGVNTATVTVGGGFTFAETGTDSVTLEVVGYPSSLYVDSENGDDSNYGFIDAPFKTITHALEIAQAGDTIRLFPGTYGNASGEAWPLAPDGVLIQGFDPDGDADREEHILDGGNSVASLFTPLAAKRSIGFENLWIRDTTGPAVYADASTVAFTNVIFTQSREDRNAYGAILYRNDSQVETVDCCFTGMTRYATVAVNAHSANYNSNYTALRCQYLDNYCNRGTIAEPDGGHEVAGRFFLTDCDFIGNRVDNAGAGDGYCSSVVFIWGRHYLPSTIQMDRCRLVGNSGGSLISISNTAGELPEISNSLIAGNDAPCGMFLGYSWKMRVDNCTFVNNNGGYAARACNRDGYGMQIFNSILCGEDTLTYVYPGSWGDSGATNLRLHDTIVHDCGMGEGYDVGNSSNVIEDDPLLANIAVDATDPAFDASIGSRNSPAIDAGSNDNAFGDVDLLGKARIQKGTKGMFVDLGCYERFVPAEGTILIVK